MNTIDINYLESHLCEKKLISNIDKTYLKYHPYDNFINQIKYYFVKDFNDNLYYPREFEIWIEKHNDVVGKSQKIFFDILEIENQLKSLVILEFSRFDSDQMSEVNEYLCNAKGLKISEFYSVEFYLSKKNIDYTNDDKNNKFIENFPEKVIHILSFNELLKLVFELEVKNVSVLDKINSNMDNKLINLYNENKIALNNKFANQKAEQLIKKKVLYDVDNIEYIKIILRYAGKLGVLRKEIRRSLKFVIRNYSEENEIHWNTLIKENSNVYSELSKILTNSVNDKIFTAENKELMAELISEYNLEKYNYIVLEAEKVIYREYYKKEENIQEIIRIFQTKKKEASKVYDLIKKERLITDDKFFMYLLLIEMRKIRNDIAHGKTFIQTYKRRDDLIMKKIILEYFDNLEKTDKIICKKIMASYQKKYYRL